MRTWLPPLLFALAACSPSPGVTFVTTAQTDPLVAASLELVPAGQVLSHRVDAHPAQAASSLDGFSVAVVPRDDCTDCYRLEGDGRHFTVTGGLPLGVQYGVAHVLELLGYRFNHPWKSVVLMCSASASSVGGLS